MGLSGVKALGRARASILLAPQAIDSWLIKSVNNRTKRFDFNQIYSVSHINRNIGGGKFMNALNLAAAARPFPIARIASTLALFTSQIFDRGDVVTYSGVVYREHDVLVHFSPTVLHHPRLFLPSSVMIN